MPNHNILINNGNLMMQHHHYEHQNEHKNNTHRPLIKNSQQIDQDENLINNSKNSKIKNNSNNKVIIDSNLNSTIATQNTNVNVNTCKLKVLICTESFHPYTSGIARRFKEIIERLAKRGFLIHIVTGCKGSETWTNDIELKDKVTFSILKAIEFKDKIDCALPFLIPQYGILKAILEFRPDVIHCVEQTPAATFCGALGKTLNIPIVWSSHTNLDFYIPLYIYPLVSPLSLRVYQLLRRTFLNLADYNLTVSSDFVKLLNENGIKKRVNVWKTGVDSESFNPSFRSHEMRVKMFNGHYSPEKILLVSVGRLSPEKNFEFLLKLLERFPQTFLCIVGGGPYKESLEPLFPSNQTHFMGFLQGDQLASAYASADYFVYASVSETFGQVYLEAMSSGTPIVAAEGQQMKEFFINGIHGYTWRPGDINSAVKALNNSIKDRNILSQNCRSNALNHSWNSAANQIADVYSKLKRNDKLDSAYINMIPFGFKNLFSFGITLIKGFYYLSIWCYIMILVLSFMAPFMKVAKPTKQALENNSIKLKSNKNSSKNKHKKKKKDNLKQITKLRTEKDDDSLLNDESESIETESTTSNASSTSSKHSSASDSSTKSNKSASQNKQSRSKNSILKNDTNNNNLSFNECSSVTVSSKVYKTSKKRRNINNTSNSNEIKLKVSLFMIINFIISIYFKSTNYLWSWSNNGNRNRTIPATPNMLFSNKTKKLTNQEDSGSKKDISNKISNTIVIWFNSFIKAAFISLISFTALYTVLNYYKNVYNINLINLSAKMLTVTSWISCMDDLYNSATTN